MAQRLTALRRALGRCRPSWKNVAGLALLLSPTVAMGQINLAPNPSFETVSGSVPLNWTACNNSGTATLGTATSPVDQGTASLKVTVTQQGDVGVCSDLITVASGVTFRLGVRSDVNIASTINKQVRLQVVELSSSLTQLSSKLIATSVGRTAGWESLSGFFTTGPSTAKVKIRLLHDVPGSNGVSFYWDSVALVRDTAVAWERWERELTSTVDYTVGTNSNPYRDLQLTATFYRNAACSSTPPSSCSIPDCFQQAGFWDGTQGNSSTKTFRVRTTLPAGSWCWNTTCATVPGSGATTPSCVGDTGLTRSGVLAVTPPNSTGTNLLYRLGLPMTKSSFLTYGDGTTTFPWIADTAWSAPKSFPLPALGTAPSTDLWKNYAANRHGKGFTVLLVAPANQYINAPASRPTPPASGFVGFLAQTGCTPVNYKVVPNECSYLDPVYWQKVDSMVKDANDAGIAVLMAGLIDPTDRGGSSTSLTPPQKYPRKEAAVAFARQLAARLAGSFVFFSPGFDDKVDELLDDNVTKTQASISAVGQALRGTGSAAPRHLVGNQLGGGVAITDYDLFHTQIPDWLSFELYQSGHKGNMSTPCNYNAPQEYARAVCRAREISLRFRCQGAASTVQDCPTSHPPAPPKPAVNSEGAYEDFTTVAEDPDNREGVRHTAYASALSGSFGYTIGVKGIYDWTNPAIYSDSYQSDKSKSDRDVTRLGSLLSGGPWTDLEPRHNLIANNPVVNTNTNPPMTGANPTNALNEKTRMLLAGNSTYALAYVPGVSSGFTGVQIKTTGVTNALMQFDCGGCWSKVWVDPRSQAGDKQAICTTGNGKVTLTNLPSCPTPNIPCDWVLRLTRGSAASCTSSFAGLNDLEVWTELSTDSTTSAVLAQVLGQDGLPVGDPMVVSPDGTSFQKLPTLAMDSLGKFFITWEAQNPDTGVDEIFAQRFDNAGNPLGDVFPVSQASEGQQAEPSVTADPDNNFVVSWTRYALDDAPSSIELQLFDVTGAPTGDTIGLPPDPEGGVSTMSLVQSDGQANLWVVWTVEDRKNEGGDVYAQRILRGGALSGSSIRISSTHAGVRRLAALRVQRDGSFRVVWEGLGAGGQGRGLRERRYDAQGHPLENETPVSSVN